MWPLILSRDVVLEQKIDAPSSEVLKLLHDPKRLCSLSPLMKSVEKDKDDPSTVICTERLPMMGGKFESSTVFRCTMNPEADGVLMEVFAGAGTSLRNHMQVEGLDEKTSLVKEHTTVKAVFFFMPFVLSTMVGAHKAVLERLNAAVKDSQ
ncbi:hypothetical protein BKA70DRAFT_1251884 [Coprinopsis sp. MPI-PUGE-AT-0042]|nr:hypothetical protein BKA70DRAFT_1251884 [Coprinopsis sp. MPI-PUGE-AT-0042]